ncbi:phosphatidic acid phosphatase type 2/haloperoxidase, partial [Chytriomyces sp. MP71]
SMRNTHRFLLALGFALALTVATTNILKTTIGRFRPDFLDRCQYSAASQDCMGDAALVRDGRMSFPSGHSSFSFAGAVMLMLWTARTLRLYGGNAGNDKPSGLARAGRGYVLLLALVPLWIAGYVAVSRLQQFVHHPTDVIGGSLIGSAISIFVFSAQFW